MSADSFITHVLTLIELEILVDEPDKDQAGKEADGAEHDKERQAGHQDEAKELCRLKHTSA